MYFIILHGAIMSTYIIYVLIMAAWNWPTRICPLIAGQYQIPQHSTKT